jgi:hypothetical protein
MTDFARCQLKGAKMRTYIVPMVIFGTICIAAKLCDTTNHESSCYAQVSGEDTAIHKESGLLEWKTLPCVGLPNVNKFARAKITGGWLVAIPSEGASVHAVTFVPDETHSWSGQSIH